MAGRSPGQRDADPAVMPELSPDELRRLDAAQGVLDLIGGFEPLVFLPGHAGAVHMASVVALVMPVTGGRADLARELVWNARENGLPLRQVLPGLYEQWIRRAADEMRAIDDTTGDGHRLRVAQSTDGRYEITVTDVQGRGDTTHLTRPEMVRVLTQAMRLPGLRGEFEGRGPY